MRRVIRGRTRVFLLRSEAIVEGMRVIGVQRGERINVHRYTDRDLCVCVCIFYFI